MEVSEYARCMDYITMHLNDEGGDNLSMSQAEDVCALCPEEISECAKVGRCVGGYCLPPGAPEQECGCTEGAACLDDYLYEPPFGHCPNLGGAGAR